MTLQSTLWKSRCPNWGLYCLDPARGLGKYCEVRETLEWINTIETLDVPALLNPAACLVCDRVERLTSVGRVAYGAVEWFQEPSQLLNRACGCRFSPKLTNPLGLGAYLAKVEDMSLPGVKRHPFWPGFSCASFGVPSQSLLSSPSLCHLWGPPSNQALNVKPKIWA